MSFMTRFNDAHERLKHRVHSYWRQNKYLSPRSSGGKFFMSCVYFSIPVVVGYYISTYTVNISESTIEERFGGGTTNSQNKNDRSGGSGDDNATNAASSNRISSLGGDKIIVGGGDGKDPKVEKIGAGGWGGGVHLVTGDQDTQDVNRINLERFLKKQQREKMKRDKQREKKEKQQRQEQEEQS
mmetsp:Transcript_55838/g.135271  ORF Transcript_55838/g.135271 Transcript_55838/m.135271 type:complete len:184 (+) Transcript_55838:98-649(+)